MEAKIFCFSAKMFYMKVVSKREPVYAQNHTIKWGQTILYIVVYMLECWYIVESCYASILVYSVACCVQLLLVCLLYMHVVSWRQSSFVLKAKTLGWTYFTLKANEADQLSTEDHLLYALYVYCLMWYFEKFSKRWFTIVAFMFSKLFLWSGAVFSSLNL